LGACVLLSYINGIPDRLPDLEWYLERSGKGFQLVTSTVTIVEVAFAVQERERMALDAATEAKISGLWVVYHLAAAVGVRLILDQPVQTIETNLVGSEIVLRVAAQTRTRVVLASTSEAN
jgi:nucleoside-diphosphate-sugar epimerase